MKLMQGLLLGFNAVAWSCGIAIGQIGLSFNSLDWLAADADVIVRGVVVDLTHAPDTNALSVSMVTLDVGETLKGERVKRLKFAIDVVNHGNLLERWKKNDDELLCFLKRKQPQSVHRDVRGGAQQRDAAFNRYDVDLYAIGWGWGVMAFGARTPEDHQPAPPIFGIDLRLLETRDEILKATREAVAKGGNGKPIRPHRVYLPGSIAQRTGRRGDANILVVPIDERLESLAMHLIRSPAQFLPDGDTSHHDALRQKGGANEATKYLLRQEGVKALKYFKSDGNIAVLKSLLADSSSGIRDGEEVYGVREVAYQTLRSWDCDIDKPVLKRASRKE